VRRTQAAAAGIVLKNGTILAGEVKEMDETLVTFEPIGGSRQILNTLNIARVQFRSMSPQLAARISSGSPGILLLNGDFVEGELKSFKKGRVTVSSVIFGLRSYDTANQAAALVLRPFQNGAKFVVRTSTGSALFADTIDVDQEALLLAEHILGKLRLKSNELLDIRRLPELR
jgi:sRNA-binding regulator protein Hfq